MGEDRFSQREQKGPEVGGQMDYLKNSLVACVMVVGALEGEEQMRSGRLAGAKTQRVSEVMPGVCNVLSEVGTRGG